MTSAIVLETNRRPIRFGRLVGTGPKRIDVEITPAPSRAAAFKPVDDSLLVKSLLAAALGEVATLNRRLDGRKGTQVSIRRTQIEVLRDAALECRQRLDGDSALRAALNEGLDLAEAATDLTLPYRNQDQALEALVLGAKRAHDLG